MDSFLEQNIYDETLRTLAEQARPSVLLRPSITVDGNAYCVLYGSDLMNGVAGFGETADLAMRDFDKNWVSSKAPSPAKCRLCGDTGKPLDRHGHCHACVSGMARTNGD